MISLESYFRSGPLKYNLMKKHLIRYQSPSYLSHRANHYYALGDQHNAANLNNKDKHKNDNSRSKSNKSNKGISLTKNIKRTFEEFYFGVPMKEEAPKIQSPRKKEEMRVMYRPLKIIPERPRSVERKVVMPVRYHSPIQYEIIRPVAQQSTIK